MAVNKGTHLHYCKRFSQVTRVIFVTICVLLVLPLPRVAANLRLCQDVRNDFRNREIAADNILDRPIKGIMCADDSCCGPAMESQLLISSIQQLDTFVKDSLSKLSSILDTKAKQFDEFFRSMMNSSKAEFHEMFQKTYGVIYLKNSDVFMDFFEELEKYYNNGRSRLSDVMENFFGILYQRMFTVINAQYQFDDNYLDCVAEHMIELKPFGDVPQKLGNQLSRSFVATRTFYKILVMGAEIARNMAKLKMNSDCDKKLMQMQYCGLCKGVQGAGSCSTYCVHVLQSCLGHHIKLDEHWNAFVDALDKVADRLLGPFNIEMVVGPINIQISDAVMNFQESGEEVSQRVFVSCGNPKTTRPKRATQNTDKDMKHNKSTPPNARNPDDEISFESLNFGGGNKKKKKNKKVPDKEPSMQNLIKEIKQRVKDSRLFWSQLPYQYCNNEKLAAGPSSGGNCWNGSLTNYSTLDSQVTTSPSELQNQIYKLQVLVSKLQAAHQGQDVDLHDDTEESLESGSGSGQSEIEGSGDDSKEEPTLPTVLPTSSVRPVTEIIPRVVHASSTTSLPRALLHYVLPIILVWFGGAFSDML